MSELTVEIGLFFAAYVPFFLSAVIGQRSPYWSLAWLMVGWSVVFTACGMVVSRY